MEVSGHQLLKFRFQFYYNLTAPFILISSFVIYKIATYTMRFLFTLLVMLLYDINANLVIDFRSSTIGTSIFWVRAKIAIKGGKSPYIYQYTELPGGWKQVNEYVYIPIADTANANRYPCRLKVRDNWGEQLAATIVFVIEKGRVFIDGVAYDFEKQFQSIQPVALRKIEESTNIRVATGTVMTPSRPTYTPSVVPSNKISSGKEVSEEQNYSNNNRYDAENNSTSGSSFFEFSYSGAPSSFTATKPTLPKAVAAFELPELTPTPPVKKNLEREEQAEIVEAPQSFKPKQPTIQEILSNYQVTTDTSDESLDQAIQKTIQNVTTQIKTPNKSIDDIFRRLPTFQELDDIILSVDILAISKTIQEVIVSEMDCENKIAYLSELSGRIQNNVERKKLSLSKLQLIKDLAKEQLKRLMVEVDRLTDEQKSLDLFALSNKLQDEVLKLEQAYETYNKAVAEQNQAEKRLPTYESEAKLLRESLNTTKNSMVLKKKELELAEQHVQKIKEELRGAEKVRDRIQNEFRDLERSVLKIEQSLKQVLADAKKTSETILTAPKRLDSLKRSYLLLEVEVGRIREDIKLGLDKEERILANLTRLQEEIEAEEEKINQREIDFITTMIELLERNLPNIQREVNKLYYACYEASQIVAKSKDLNSLPSYLIDPDKYVAYLEMAYGLKSFKKMEQIKNTEEISLTQSSVFSLEWEQLYGSSVNKTADSKQSSSVVNNDFSCLRPSTLQTNSGVIKYIRKNLMIAVGDDGNIYKLYLGSCSRIQSAGSQVPIVGQRIFWKGNQEVKWEFDVYTASSF